MAASVRIALIAAALCGTLGAAANQWASVGPEGGPVLSLVADPLKSSTEYAATCAGVWKSVDGGANWSAVSSGLPIGRCITALGIDPQNAAVYAVANCRVFKTADGGASWNPLNMVGGCVDLLTVDPGNSGTLYVRSSGVFKTTDGGANWTWLAPNDVAYILAADTQSPGTVYAESYSGFLIKSTDGGASWNPANSGLPGAVQTLVIDPRTSRTLYAVSRSPLNSTVLEYRVFKSADGGASWKDASLGFPPAPPVSAGSNRLLSLAINPQNSSSLYAVIELSSETNLPNFLLVTSTDGAASWTTGADPALAANDLNTILPDPQQPGGLYLGTNSGVLRSNDGGSHWSFANSGLRAMAVGQVAIDPRDGALLAVNATDSLSHGTILFRSADGGKDWLPAGSGLSRSVGPTSAGAVNPGLTTDPQNPHTVYILASPDGNRTGLFQSMDWGQSWTQLWSDTASSTLVGPLTIDSQDPRNLYAGLTTCSGSCDTRISKSTNGGVGWNESPVNLTGIPALSNGFNCCSVVGAVAIDPQNSGTLYAGTLDDSDTASGLWKSADGGMSWSNLALAGNIRDIAIDPRNTSTIYVAGDSLYKSADGGQTWNMRNSGLPLGIGRVLADPLDSSILYCAAGGSTPDVFKSVDGGASWSPAGAGLAGNTTGYIYSLTIDPLDQRTLYAATSYGLFALDVVNRRRPTPR